MKTPSVKCPDWLAERIFDAGGNWFDGKIFEVAVWDIALSDQDINNLFNNNNSVLNVVNQENLVGYWDFNDGVGTTLTDLSGNG